MKKIALSFVLPFFFYFSNSQVQVTNLLCENLSNPNCIDAKQPRLSWQIKSSKRNSTQTAYEILVSDRPITGDFIHVLWRSGKVNSDSSVHVIYKGTSLKAGTKYFWKVRAWDNDNKVSNWSEMASWQMGLLSANDWKAKWIQQGFAEDTINRPAINFRKEFNAAKQILSATIYLTSHGMYEACINGKRVGDAYLTPGWTSYNKRLQYQAYDVTTLLAKGKNAIGVTLGNGWYRGFLAWDGNKNVWGKDLSLLLQLNIKYSDGSEENVVSDESWKSSTGSVLSNEIYNGDIIDTRKEKPNWCNANFNDVDWSNVEVKDYSKSVLVATENELVKKHETFQPVKIFITSKGEKIIDFGQNLVGWVRVKVKGNAGDTVRIYHAEVLDKYGNFYTDNLRAAKAQAVYILNGNEQTLEPAFTFFGFRYIKIEGYPGEIKPEDFIAVALYSDMEPTGTFSCSNAMINQLQHNIQWGQKGNFLDVPTDCPQRDERLGWTGDAQVFSRTAAFNMNVNNFFAKWLKDVAADQFKDGSIPFVIPNVLGEGAGGSTGWADVSTIIPWNMYLAYGDKKILEQQYSSMKAWIEFMKSKSENDLWNSGFHFGDWLFYRPFDDNDGRSAVTDKYLIAQCFYAHSTQLLINAANVLGKQDDVATYTELLHRIKDAFMKEYVTQNGRLVSGTQTAYVLVLNFDMLPDSLQRQAAERLVENIKDYDNHLTTGFLGTPYLCHVLTRFGYDSVAYKLLLQDTYPSWLYPVKMGATTIWERWDGIKPDSTFETPGMNSFNHYSYGAIGDWMYRVVAGIDTYEDGPGYKHIKIMPHVGGGFTYANADYKTYYGNIGSHWKIDNSNFILDVEIPANTTATIFIPTSNVASIKESNKLFSSSQMKIPGSVNGYVQVEIGSGKYHFSASVNQ
ncbi:MAG: family 78 glycoside hydrolase catalytic domain [Parafilimonas sp.]|nr:family 78 glycoside hydrolase catalytic domain [Parafilimonas sp.]